MVFTFSSFKSLILLFILILLLNEQLNTIYESGYNSIIPLISFNVLIIIYFILLCIRKKQINKNYLVFLLFIPFNFNLILLVGKYINYYWIMKKSNEIDFGKQMELNIIIVITIATFIGVILDVLNKIIRKNDP